MAKRNNESVTLRFQESISLPMVFIDGITRCGKSAFSGIIPSLSRMEHIQMSTEMELIMAGLSLGVNQFLKCRSLIIID